MSKIEWCDLTINPIVGCSHASTGCARCFAEGMARRIAAGLCKDPATRGAYQQVIGPDGKWNGKTAVVSSGVEKLRKLANVKKPQRVFVGSMTDPLHEATPVVDIRRVLAIVTSTARRHHTFLFLTKRPQRLAEVFENFGPGSLRRMADETARHVWLGVTAENRATFSERVATLCDLWPGNCFASLEPLLAPIDMSPHGKNPGVCGLDWVIAGCESGPNRRPAEVDWFRQLRDQCAAARVPFFLKQAECVVDAGRFAIAHPQDGLEAIATASGVTKPGELIKGCPRLDGTQHAERPTGMKGARL